MALSSERRVQQERPTRFERMERPTRLERMEQPTRPIRPIRPTRMGRPERPTRISKRIEHFIQILGAGGRKLCSKCGPKCSGCGLNCRRCSRCSKCGLKCSGCGKYGRRIALVLQNLDRINLKLLEHDKAIGQVFRV